MSVYSAVSTALLRDFKLPYNKLCLEEAALHQSQILIFVSKNALSDQCLCRYLTKCKINKKGQYFLSMKPYS